MTVEVSDEGAGFAQEPEDVFAPRIPVRGHGIGLSLANSLAEADGARLVLSRRGPRPALTLHLPDARIADSGTN